MYDGLFTWICSYLASFGKNIADTNIGMGMNKKKIGFLFLVFFLFAVYKDGMDGNLKEDDSILRDTEEEKEIHLALASLADCTGGSGGAGGVRGYSPVHARSAPRYPCPAGCVF